MPSRIAAENFDIEGRTQLRQERFKPLLASMHDWFHQSCLTVANGGGTARPSITAPALGGAVDTPRTGDCRSTTIRWRTRSGRSLSGKRTGFCRSSVPAKRAAAMQSLLATASFNGLDPAAWLRETL